MGRVCIRGSGRTGSKGGTSVKTRSQKAKPARE
jgi:hypothetical protein